jgi:hypothetical protein
MRFSACAELKLAQGVDIQIGRDRYDRYDRYDRDRRRNDATVGIGPGGVTIGPRQRCGRPVWDGYRGIWVRPRIQVCD